MERAKKIVSAILLWAILIWSNFITLRAIANEDFTATSAEEEAYWYSRYNLGNLVMRSGMWEKMVPDMDMVMMALAAVDSDFDKEKFMKWNDDYGDGNHPRPPVNPYLLKSVYKSGDPHYVMKFDVDDFATQAWDQDKMDKTLTPEAFAYTIQKEVEWAKDFHGDEHFWKIDDDFGSQWRFVWMMMNMEAKMQAKYVMENMDNLEENASVYWHFAMLWAISDLAAMLDADMFEANTTNRYKDSDWSMMFRNMADMIFKKWYDEWMLPENIKEYGTAIKSLVWYVKATKNIGNKKSALRKIVDYSNELVFMKSNNAWEEAYRLAWLIEAYRVTWINAEITINASQDFLDNFDMDDRIFKWQNTYTIDEVWTIIWALNEIKLFVVDDTQQAEKVFKDFFENVVNESWLIQSAPPIMVAKDPFEYEGEPENYFRYPTLKFPPMAGWKFWIAPVFATEVSFDNGKWTVTDSDFDTAWAMHASNEMIWLHYDELNGFPELYKLNSKDKRLLNRFKTIVSKLDNFKKEKLIERIHNLYSKNPTNSRLVVILKEVESYLR